MSDQLDKPHLVTKPIQLLAAWLVGLSALDASFLGAAKLIGTGTWECGLLVIAAVLNVPGFILSLFLLQTKFRPEMQEDSFYSEYISHKTGLSHHVNKIELLEKQVEEMRAAAQHERQARKSPDGPLIARPAINDYLPFYSNLRKALRDADIKIAGIFGKAIGVKNPPEGLYIAVADDLTAEQIFPVLRVCCDFPFQGFHMTSRFDETEDDMYLGSYGRADDKLTPFTPEIKDEIKNSTDDSLLVYMLKKN